MLVGPFGVLEENVACSFHFIAAVAGRIRYVDVHVMSSMCCTGDWVVDPFT